MTAPDRRAGADGPSHASSPRPVKQRGELRDQLYEAMESLPNADARHWMQAYLLGWLAQELLRIPSGPALWAEGLSYAVASAGRLS